ncbi:MAG TPA: carboxypeptidase regulatory-like domain-containing protein [Gemmatimonadaceae bacterium]|nr:carboxypeptidase regulatory-like domain-containing protein [Gemmatimonadaceae bacterium]
MRLVSKLLFAAALAICAQPLRAQGVDVIRGQVLGPDGQPLENAKVTATSLSGNVNRIARTDRNGRYTITFPGGEGDYFVEFSALGYGLRRFEVKRTADQEILVADARLQRAAGVLDTVRVVGQRDRPERNDNSPDISGSERPVDNSAVPADQQGDIASMAASLPGVTLVPGQDGDPSGFSVLGLSPDQNNTTLNGMNFGGSNLPRDANVSTSLVTTPYDVSRGGFSGAQFQIRSRPGSNFVMRTMSLNVDAPQLQWTDRAARSLGQQYSNVSLGGLFAGPIKPDASFFSLAYQLGRRANDLRSLINTNAIGLQTSGVSPDSVLRLLSILQRFGIPTQTSELPSSRLGEQGSLFGNLDFAPQSSSTGQAIGISFNGSWNQQTPVSSLTNEVPAHSGDRTNWNAGLQARHNNYYGGLVLSETSFGLSRSRNYGSPYLDMPSGTVRINSQFPDGTSSIRNIAFGGNSNLNTDQTNTGTELTNQLSWFSASNKHRIKLTTELRRDAFTLNQQINTLGSFNYNSLADLEAEQPSSFSRQLSPRIRSGSQFIGGMSLGDSYKRTDNLQIQYGVRLDGNRFSATPTFNPALETAFGERNDRAPNHVYFSPRIGFSWSYGTAPQVAGFLGAVRGPRAVIRGGIGLFQNVPNTTLISGAIDNTGLASALQQVLCAGPSTPVPDWSTYATDPSNVPAQCTDGSVFASTVPNVTFFANDYTAPKSLRSNLNWSGPVLGNRFSGNVEATYSRNMNQASIVDLNFNPVVQFTLPDEAQRPVFVQTSSIVPQTGTIASRDARVSQLFSRVTELRSDLKSDSRQLRFSLSPAEYSSNYNWSLSYVYSSVREQTRGFNSTVGNPLAIEWGRSAFDSRHQIQYNLGYNFFDAVRVNWFGSFRSGSPYTPVVAGDINGDGYNNDRAFIYDPAKTTDPLLASQMQSLIAKTSGNARECLLKQLNTLAERNSCQGPWISQATLSLAFNPLKFRMPQRATLSLQIGNPLGAADLLLHGNNNLRGWGQFAFPDPTLLAVRGFDAQNRRYLYDVNDRFGSTQPALTAVRAPVTVTAMMRFDLGPTRERQALTQQLDRGRTLRGNKAPEPMLRAIYGSGGIPNPLSTILRQADTLGLSGMQADSIASMNRRYVVRLDSIWSPVTKYLAALPDKYNKDEAYSRYQRAREASVDMLIGLVPTIRDLLTPSQRRKLPAYIASYLDTRYLASIRSGTAGAGANGPMMFGGPGGGNFTFQGGGPGGGGQVIIIRN